MITIFTTNRNCIRKIEYSLSPTPFGEMLTAWCQGWLCYATFTRYLTQEVAMQEMQRLFPKAEFTPSDKSFDPTTSRPKRILLVGTAFRLDVWRALIEIPRGTTITYAALASRANHPKAIRAVATSVGCNPISVVVPCHRILPASGGIGNYHSGVEIKRLLLLDEQLS